MRIQVFWTYLDNHAEAPELIEVEGHNVKDAVIEHFKHYHDDFRWKAKIHVFFIEPGKPYPVHKFYWAKDLLWPVE